MDYTVAQVRLFSDAVDDEEQAKNKMFMTACRASQFIPKDYKKLFEELFD